MKLKRAFYTFSFGLKDRGMHACSFVSAICVSKQVIFLFINKCQNPLCYIEIHFTYCMP